jgi:hypothetical protein
MVISVSSTCMMTTVTLMTFGLTRLHTDRRPRARPVSTTAANTAVATNLYRLALAGSS